MSGAQLTDPQSRHASHLRLLSVTLGVSFGFYAARNALLGRPRTALVQMGGLLAMFAIYLYVRRERRAARLVATTHVLLGAMLACTSAIVLSNGLAATSVPWVLSALTLPAAYLLGARPGVVWCVISGIAMVGLTYVGKQRWVAPEFVVGTPELALQLAWYHVAIAILAIAARLSADRHIEAVEEQKQTIEAQAAALRQAHAAALAASEAKTAFLSTVTHELRTPLHAILGMSSVVAESALDPAQREAMATIQRSADALSALIGDVLDYSKIEAGKIEIQPEETELLELVEQAVDMVAFAANAKGLLIVQRRPATVARVIVDPLRVRQVLTNLLSNAVKFSERGTIEIAVHGVPGPDEDGVMEIHVRDEGIGLASDEAARLFRPFSQASADTSRRFGGTGLGLAISYAIAELLGGDVRVVESAKGRGATFGFRFRARGLAPRPGPLTGLRVGVLAPPPSGPDLADLARHLGAHVVTLAPRAALPAIDALLLVPSADDPALRSATAAAHLPVVVAAPMGTAVEGNTRVVRQPLRSREVTRVLKEVCGRIPTPARIERIEVVPPLAVLVVDDDPINRMVMARMLEQAGHHPDVVADGESALARVETRRYDVALIDMRMPGIDGPTTARRMIQQLGRERPHLVALTANASAHDRTTCLAAGMDAFLSKPLRLPELRAALAHVQPKSEGPADFDARVLAELAALPGGEGGLLGELSGVFFADAPRRLVALRDALGREDRRVLEHEAHSIKGAAGTLGFRRIAHLAADLEARAKADDPGQLAQLLEQLRTSVAEAEARLPQRLLTPQSFAPR